MSVLLASALLGADGAVHHLGHASSTPRLHGGSLATERTGGAYALRAVALADEEFIAEFGDAWKDKVRGVVEGANLLLGDVRVELQVESLQPWRSPDGVLEAHELVKEDAGPVPADAGRLSIVFTGQAMRRYDGFTSETGAIVLIKVRPADLPHREIALAHEIGHVLGAGHHAEEECDDASCIMESRGYRHSVTWCRHHTRTVAATLADWDIGG